VDPTQLSIEVLGGILVGLSLGLVGAGGAIFSVPIFALVLGHPIQTAILEALAVTGIVAAFSALAAARSRRVEFATALAFLLPGMVGAWLGGPIGRWLPDDIQAGIFSVVAATAAVRMLRSAQRDATQGAAEPRATLVTGMLVGFAIGILTSVIGVGGGFLLVPALTLLARLDISRAIGTSLVVITANAAMSLVSNGVHDPAAFEAIAWSAVTIVAACGLVGSAIGSRLAARLPAVVLKRVFAGLLIGVAALFALESLGITNIRADAEPSPSDPVE
jgi:uncharacterized membrane protein YfcA